MIIREYYRVREDGVTLYRTYSTEGFCILQKETGEVYDDAIDIEGAPYTYEETDIKIDEYEES